MMIAAERRKRILAELSEKGVISLKETAELLDTSEITVRRDFEKLEKEGRLKRVHGGAVAGRNDEGAELSMDEKKALNNREKVLVSEYAEAFVADGQSVFIDSGTTMLPLFTLLSRHKVRLITCSTIGFEKLRNPIAEIILIGGRYQPEYRMNLGPFAQDMLKLFSFDVAFFSCTGIDLIEKAVFTAEPESYALKKIAMDGSRTKFLMADSTKIGCRGFVKMSDLSIYKKIFTNEFASDVVLPENLVMI